MISAKIIADSIHSENRVTTFELEYPRYIHAELLTHRVFSRNAASSRAIPVDKVIEQVEKNTVMPMWTAKKKGMQGDIITEGMHLNQLNSIWLGAAQNAIEYARGLDEAGAHKQNVNRVLEPFQHIKVVLTATDFDNWFRLRNHADAQPEIRALAREMFCEYAANTPDELASMEWHLPYARANLSHDNAAMVSASCCAQVSYRLADDSLEKAADIYQRLVTSTPMHASPFEHQCRPLMQGEAQVGNLRGFRQLRHDIEQ